MRRVLRKTIWIGLCGAAWAAGCGNFQGSPQRPFTSEVFLSPCDGFRAADRTLLLSTTPPVMNWGDNLYCDAERLYWSYDPAGKALILYDSRAMLNCCGVHGLETAMQGGTLVVTETDDPEALGRCSCMCPFDYVAVLDGIEAGTLPLRIIRDVSDWPDGSGTVFEGPLDLALGEGVEILDETDPGGFCEEP